MSGDSSTSLVDRLWRAALLLLATTVALYIAWHLLWPLLPFLVVAVALVGVIRLAVGGTFGGRHW